MSALGSLVVKLALQHAEFTGGLDKSEQAALAAAKRIQDTFDSMKSRIASTAGAIAGGLAAGFTVAAFKGLISGAIETGAALDDLRQQTGATVEALSGMLAVGKFNDVGPEQLGAAMNKLASNLAGATEESKGTGKALAALGINIDDFRKLKPEEQMQQVAKAMGDFEDGAGKSAVAMALFGKEGAKMIPFFNDLASVGELQAKMTTEQAAAAANLDDNLKRLSTSGDGWKKELANGMIPALDQGAQALLDVMNGTGGLREKVKGLAADGSIKEWTRNAIMGFSYVADVVQGLMSMFPIMGKAIGAAMAATGEVVSSVYSAFQKIRGGDLGGAMTDLEQGFARVKAIGVEAGQDISEVWNQKLFGERLRERMNELETSTAGAGDAAEGAHKKQLTFANAVEKTGKAAAEAKDPVAALLDTIGKRTAAYAGELAAGEKLTEGEKTAIEVLDQLRTGKVKVTEAEAELIGKRLESMLVLEQQVTLQNEERKQLEALRAERIKHYQAVEQGVTTLADQNKSLKEEIELIGLTDEAQLRVIRGRNNQAIATKQAALAELELQAARTGTMSREQIALQQEIELLQERNELLGQQFDAKQVEKQSAAWMEMWNSVDRTAHDVFVDVADNGMDAFKRIGKTLKASILDLLYQMTLRKWIFQILASVTGSVASGVASAAGNSIGSGMMGSIGGSVLGNMVGSVAMAGTTGLANMVGFLGGDSLGVLAAGASGGFSSAIAAAIGQIPVWGWIAGGLLAIASALDDSGTYHTGGAAQYSADKGLSSGQSGADYNIGFGRVEEGKETITAVGNIAKGIVTALDGLSVAFGGKGGYEVGTAYADDTSSDMSWGAFRISKEGKELLNWDDTRQSKWAPKEFADGEAGYKQYLAAVAKDTRDVLMENMDLPSWARDMLQALGDAPEMDQLTAVIQQIGVVQSVFVQLGESITTFADMSDEAFAAIMNLSGGIDALASNAAAYYQNFYSEDERRAAVEGKLRGQLGELGFDLPKTREEYRRLMEAQDLNTEAGRKAYATLLALSTTFAQLVPATEKVADTTDDLTDSQEDLNRAQEEAARKLEEQRRAYLDSLDKAYSSLEAAINRQIEGLQNQLQSAQQVAAAWSSVRDAAQQGKNQLLGMVQSTAAAQAKAGAAYISQALSSALAGVAPDSQKLSEAISAATSGINQPGATRFERERDALVLAGQLSQLEAASGKQLTTAEQTVEALKRQIKQGQDTLDYWKEQIALANGQLEATLSVTEAINVLTGLLRPDTGTTKPLPVGGATGATFGGGSGGAAAADPARYYRMVYGGTAGIGREAIRDESVIARLDALSGVYHSFDGSGDLAGLAAAFSAAGGTIADLSVLSGYWESDWRKAFAAAGVPAFEKGGMHAGGWAVVGEAGPELAYMPPARIYNATQTRQLFSDMQGGEGGDFRAFLASLLGEVRGLREDVRDVKQQTKRGADVLENASEGPA